MRRLLTPANAIALVALVLSASGAGYAAVKATLTGRDIVDHSLTGADVKLGSLTGAHIADRSLGVRDLAPSAVRLLGNTTIATTAQIKVVASGIGGTEAKCPTATDGSPYQIVGGGWRVSTDAGAPYAIAQAEPAKGGGVGPDGYKFAASNPNQFPITFTVTAICLVPSS